MNSIIGTPPSWKEGGLTNQPPNGWFGTLAKAFTAIVTSSRGAPVKPPVKKAAVAAASAAIDPFSEMEKGRVLEWWVLVADR